jgi:nucleoside-diphosphate-sugar epimerase
VRSSDHPHARPGAAEQVTSVAVVGARGFVGTALVRAFKNSSSFEVIEVTRDNYAELRAGQYDLVVNAAMPSGRFAAKNRPLEDFRATVERTADLFYGWKFRRFLQVSSVSARCQLDTNYGRHKAAAELVCQGPETLVVRLGPMYSETLSKGVLIDMLHGRPVFVAAESRYCFAPLEFVCDWMSRNWTRTGTVEVGARNAIALRDVAAHLGRPIEFSGAVDHQEIPAPERDFPDVSGVFDFLKARLAKGA